MSRYLCLLTFAAAVAGCTPAQDTPDQTTDNAIKTDFGAAAIALIASSPDSPLTDAPNELRVRSIDTDDLGITHVRLDQIYQTLPVIGGEAIAHFPDSPTNGSGNNSVALSLHPSPVNLDTNKPDNVAAARQVAARALGDGAHNCASCPATLAVFVAPASSGRGAAVAPRLVYQIDAGTNAINSHQFLIDTQTLRILQRTALAMSQQP